MERTFAGTFAPHQSESREIAWRIRPAPLERDERPPHIGGRFLLDASLGVLAGRAARLAGAN
jgi:hypothetical protein